MQSVRWGLLGIPPSTVFAGRIPDRVTIQAAFPSLFQVSDRVQREGGFVSPLHVASGGVPGLGRCDINGPPEDKHAYSMIQ